MRSALFLTIAIQVYVVKLRGKSTSRDGGLDRRDNSSLPYSNPNSRVQLYVRLEPISKLSEEDNEAGELDEAEEVLSVEFPADEYAALPLYPGEETLDEPASHVAAQPSSILRRRLDAIGAVWRDHLDTISSQFLVERIAVIGTVADQVFWLGFDHVEVEATTAPSGPHGGWRHAC